MSNLTFDIGQLEAEADQTMLHRAFVRTHDYEEVMKPQTRLILGRKGSGKTALFDRIAAQESAKYLAVVKIKPQDVNAEQLSILNEYTAQVPGFPKNMFLRNTIQTFIWAAIMRSIAHNSNGGLVTGQISTIYKYVTRNSWITPDFLSKFAAYAINVARRIVEKVKDLSHPEALATIASFPEDEPDFRVARDACISLCREQGVLVLIDDVDFDFHGEDSREPSMHNYYECLVMAATDLSSMGLQLKLAISNDIFFGLKLRHTDKLMGHAHQIVWTRDSLKEFIARRLLLSPTAPHGLHASQLDNVWNAFFDNETKITVDHDWRYAHTSFDYICEHSFARPRDVMLSCREINAVCNDKLGIVRASPKAVKDGVARFCNIAVQYLQDEYFARCPNFQALLGGFYQTSKVMSKTDFQQSLANGSPTPLNADEVVELSRLFYEMNVIGASYDKQLTSVYWEKPPEGVQYADSSAYQDVMAGCQTIVFHPVIAEAMKMYRSSTTRPKRKR